MRTKQFLPGIICAALLSGCGNTSNHFDASGTFEATEVIVSSETSGKITGFDLIEGDIVREGQPLATIDTLQLHLSRKQLEASRKTLAGQKTNINLQLASLQEQLISLETEKRRFENLVKSNVGNQKQVDDLQAQIIILERQIEARENTMQTSNQGIENESEALNVQIEQVEDKIARSTITSPIDGTVLLKYAEKGEVVQPGKALLKIADMENMYFRAYITANQLTRMKLGQQVKVHADFGKETREYDGVIGWISDKSEFTPKTIQTKDERSNLVYAVKIAVKNDGYLKIGMYGQVSIDNEE
jgi:HlyD family secretion protein